MTLPRLQIRPARPEGAEPLAAFAAQSFRDAFASEISAEDIEAYVPESFSTMRFRNDRQASQPPGAGGEGR